MSYADKPGYTDNLLILRGLCSLGVLVAHALTFVALAGFDLHGWLAATGFGRTAVGRLLDAGWPSTGYGFVYVFFITSGYLMGKIYWNRQYAIDRSSLWSFYRNRFLRIAPLLWVNLLACLFLFGRPHLLFSQPLKVFGDFFFINNLTGYALNTPTWSLSYEMQDYLVCPLFFLLFSRKNLRTLLLVLAVTVALAGYSWYSLQHESNIWLALARFTWNFLGGYSINLLVRYLHENGRAYGSRLLTGAGFASFFIGMFCFNALASSNRYFTAQVVLQFCVIAAIILFELPSRRARDPAFRLSPGLLIGRLFTWLGHISYGVYLWHMPIILSALAVTSKLTLGLQRIVPAGVPEVPWVAGSFVLIIVAETVVVSLVTFYLVELRFRPNIYNSEQSRVLVPLWRAWRGRLPA